MRSKDYLKKVEIQNRGSFPSFPLGPFHQEEVDRWGDA